MEQWTEIIKEIETREYPIGFDSLDAIEGKSSKLITQKLAKTIRPTKLILPLSIRSFFKIHCVVVNGDKLTPLNFEVKDNSEVINILDSGQILENANIDICVSNISNIPKRFLACIIGDVEIS